jgi:Phosphoesterase family
MSSVGEYLQWLMSSRIALATAILPVRSWTSSRRSWLGFSTNLAASTAFIITLDEGGGGYFDSGYMQPIDFFGDGPRIPLIIVSPFTRGGYISHEYADHASVVKSSSAIGILLRSRRAAVTICQMRSLSPTTPTLSLLSAIPLHPIQWSRFFTVLVESPFVAPPLLTVSVSASPFAIVILKHQWISGRDSSAARHDR